MFYPKNKSARISPSSKYRAFLSTRQSAVTGLGLFKVELATVIVSLFNPITLEIWFT
jgi:hypothetical protein